MPPMHAMIHRTPQTMHQMTATSHKMSIRIQVSTQTKISTIQHNHLLQQRHHQLQLSDLHIVQVVEIHDHTGSQMDFHTHTKNRAQQL